MIVTTAALVLVFASALGLLLAIGLGAATLWSPRNPDHRDLVFGALRRLIVLVRAVEVGALYATLVSYVPLIPGARCPLGVTQARPPWAGLLHGLEPLALWMACVGAALPPRPGTGWLRWYRAVALVSLVASAGSLGWLILDKGGQEVSCCRMVVDRGEGSSVGVFDLGHRPRAVVAALARSTGLGLGFALLWRAMAAPLSTRGWLLVATLAGVHGVLAAVHATCEVAPLVGPGPGHPCPYCLLTPGGGPSPLAILALIFLALVTGIPPAMAVLMPAERREERTVRPEGSESEGPERNASRGPLIVILVCLVGAWVAMALVAWSSK